MTQAPDNNATKFANADDAERMESSLVAAGGLNAAFRQQVFDRFFEAYPDRRSTFLHLAASSIRMTDETIEMMIGLAKGEPWVWPLVAELVFTHRSYGRLPWEEYEGWMSLSIACLAERAGDVWDAQTEAAWQLQRQNLLDLILEARQEWEQLMPAGYVNEILSVDPSH